MSLLLDAIAQTALDVLLAFAVLSALVALALVGWCAACILGERKQRADVEPRAYEPMDFSGEIRVRDRTRRGPEPVRSNGRR